MLVTCPAWLLLVSIPLCMSFSGCPGIGLRLRAVQIACKMHVMDGRNDDVGSLCSRRNAVLLGGSFLGASLLNIAPAYAEKDVADGGLPDGVGQLNRILNANKEVIKLSTARLRSHAEDSLLCLHSGLTSAKEWRPIMKKSMRRSGVTFRYVF